MAAIKTERSNCGFAAQQSADGRSQVVVKLFHETISQLNNAVVGFDLLGGITVEQAKKIAELLNENVLDLFVIVTDASG